LNAALISRRGSLAVTSALVIMGMTMIPGTAKAQSASQWSRFLAGGALALGLHEAGHLAFDVSFDASPGIAPVRFGPLPFFAITHDTVSPAREFAISSAGFWVQQGSSEILLTRRPRLRDERAPLLKGMLAFNVLASVAYAGAAFAHAGPDERDTRGIALSANLPEPAVGTIVLTPALLDALRYYRPDAAWAKWGSRAAKVAGVLLIAKARRTP
jgi:hypothetical protein